MRKRRRHLSLDRALTDREWETRKAAISASHGERRSYPESRNPSPVEKAYLSAIEAFEHRRMTAGYDWMERGDHRALLRLGREDRRRNR